VIERRKSEVDDSDDNIVVAMCEGRRTKKVVWCNAQDTKLK